MSVMPKLALGPLSSEIIEAVYRHPAPLMLIASKNQIDHEGGYVNSWTTARYCHELDRIRRRFPSHVLVCRDHCGPGFNGNMDISDSYRTVEADITHGFDLIHFDFCHYTRDKLKEARKLIEFALSLKPDLLIEIGTDENNGNGQHRPDLKAEIDFFLSFCKPVFYVVQTGSLVMEMKQVGTFDKDQVKKSADVIHDMGLKLKEHNADYLTDKQIKTRTGLVDSVNIAPQLGVVQTLFVLTQAAIHGVDATDFLNVSYESGRWKKWYKREADRYECAVASGHYNYTSKEYYKLYHRISTMIDLREGIVGEITKVINLYLRSL